MSANNSGQVRAELLRDPNYRKLAAGAIVSLLGDQFTLIALPWLVMRLTSDTLAMGIVMVMTNVPRMLFILLGGVLVDRYSAKRVLMLSQCLNGALLGLIAVLTLGGWVSLWMIYLLALGIGFATAFSLPSWSAIVAQVVKNEQFPVANGLLMSATQVSAILGPVLAGILIASTSSAHTLLVKDAFGVASAFLIDFASFAFSILAISAIHVKTPPSTAASHGNTWQSIAEGIRYFWNDRSLRTASLYGVSIVFFVGGPIQVAMPVLAAHFGQSAVAFGTLSSAFSIGGIIGITLFSFKPGFRVGTVGTTMLLIDFLVGILFIPMGRVDAVWQAATILAAIGVLGGFLQPMVFSWMQARVPPALLGRVMSVFMFLMMGVPLVSIASAGWLMRSVSHGAIFMASGVLLILIVLFALAMTSMPSISDRHLAAEVE